MTDGADAGILAALEAAAGEEGADLKIIAPAIGGITASDGSHRAADEKLGGGPSVIFDAVAVVPSKDGAAKLAQLPAAKDFVNDAYARVAES